MRPDGLAGNRVRAMLEDRQDAIWFATTDGGVGRYHDQQFLILTTEDGLASNRV